MAERRHSLLRNHGGGHAPVSNIELFFDLVFVFAITQLSHALHDSLSGAGLFGTAVLFLAVWWAWIYTAWATNWTDPEAWPVRLMLLVLMLASLAMAVSIPTALGSGGALFAGSYLAIQLGRTLFLAGVFARENSSNARNFVRITMWFVYSAPFWAIGTLSEGTARIAWWALALAIEYAGPFCFFRVPFLGRSTTANWDISGSHMAERCSLFIIIALGEGVVVTGTALSGQPLEAGRAWAVLAAFLTSALMWWLYFDLGASRGARRIHEDAQPGLLARNAYTYLHMPIVAGIVVGAVSDALVLEHWGELASRALVLTLCGGTVLFLVGLAGFKRYSSPLNNLPLSHGVASLLFLALGLWAWFAGIGTLALAGWAAAILAMAAVWEWGSFHGGWKERFLRLIGREVVPAANLTKG